MPSLYTTKNYCKIWYHSAFATHNHQIPTKDITTSGLGDAGSLIAWDSTTIDVVPMIETLIDKLGEVVPSTTVYDKFVLYQWNTAELYYQPYYEQAYSVTGSAAGLTGQAKAVQCTLSIKNLGFGLNKIVFLDRPNNNTWGNQIPVPADYTEVVAEMVSDANGWAGRNNTQPHTATNVTVSLNKRLRRKYGMI